MRRLGFARAAATVLLAGGLVTGMPHSAEAKPNYHDWGKVTSRDHTLRPGCHKYRYHYKIDPPTRYWSAEIFLVDPHGDGLASNALDANSDPDHGHQRWNICRPSTTYGKHVMKMKITYCRDKQCTGDKRDGFVRPHSFRMTH